MVNQAVINITEAAQKHLLSLDKLDPDSTHLRISVKQGGCSGLSYIMRFENTTQIQHHDEIMDYGSFKVVCDSKSLLYLYGISLEYKDDLIGGGFQFVNPNAVQTCGCGKSFSI